VTTTTKIDNEDQDAIVKNRPSLTEEQVAEMPQEAIDEYYKLDGKTCPTCLKMYKSYTGRRVHEGNAHWTPKESAKVQKKPTKKEPAAKTVTEAINRLVPGARLQENDYAIERIRGLMAEADEAMVRAKAAYFDELSAVLRGLK
jgi:hypothetical protein